MAITLINLQPAAAQSSWKTYPFIGAVPNPVGVGQETLLHIGISQQLAWSTDGWEGLTVTVTKPDGTTQTLGPFRTDSTGGTGSVFVPSQVGTYYLQTNFPEQLNPADVRAFGGKAIPKDAVMLASTSEKIELVAQAEPVQYWSGIPLPQEYWTRPIDSQLREWAPLAGSWLTNPPANYYAPFNEGPGTAHILWTTPLRTGGGLVGGALDNAEGLTDHSFEIGDAYEGKFGAGFFGGGNPIIIAGRLYYEKYAGPDRFKETACIDLRTGEEVWSRTLLDNRTISFGQLMYWDTYDYHGVYDYLWVAVSSGFFGPTNWHAFDPLTGDWVYSLQGIPSGTQVYGPKGEILRYNVNTGRGWMTLWNSSNIPELYASTDFGSMGWGQWRPMGKNVDATGPITTPTTPLGRTGYMWNKTIPTGLPGSVTAIFSDKIIGSRVNDTHVDVWGLSLKKGQEGQLLFKNTWRAPSSWVDGNLYISSGATSEDSNVLTLWSKEERKHYGFSTETGQYLWTTDESEHYLQMYVATSRAIVYDKLYSTGASGIVYCYDVKTGDKLWQYHAVDTYSEILWANDWWMGILFITDGKIYVGHEEHSPIDPRPRGAPFICIDAETGEEVWRIDGAFRQTHWGGTALLGDSVIATMDTYDQRIYGIGKGPTSTSAIIRSDVLPLGTSVLIQGMVTDVSPGTKDPSIMMRFPNGLPAVSDESMSDWMLHVYKQFPHGDIIGVPLYVHVLDENGNYRNIGETTTDPNGFFSLAWTPDIPGKYSVIVSFAGSEAYYPSYAYTAFYVDESIPIPTPAPTPEPLTMPPFDMYILYATIAIIAAIAIVGFIFRKK